MTETLWYQSDSSHQSTFTSNPFMQNHNQYTFGSNNHYHGEPSRPYKIVAPSRKRRKRKLEETDIEPRYDLCLNHPITNNMIDNKNEMALNFIKPSSKRRRTNEMSTSNKQSVILQPELEQNIYVNNVFDINDNKKNDSNQIKSIDRMDGDDNDRDRSRIDTPYEHLIHPYLKRKALRKGHNDNLNDLLSDEDRDGSPEMLFSKLNLNSFKMKNKLNEKVNEWRNSIESQLNSVRTQPSKIDDFCERIKNSSGLGREVLLAKLRKNINPDLFKQICDKMNIKNPYSR
mmetsp:Transcript_52309/g.46974  ORF Transcript_52309/g.46974 Transcript_52309/m.46974 type:complete len:287 (-) Transcript_52309:96-956(-)